MKNSITKTVAVISAIAVAIGICLCVAGAEMNGSLDGVLGRFGIYREYPNHHSPYSIDDDDFYDDFFDNDIEDFFDEFNIRGGDDYETSL